VNINGDVTVYQIPPGSPTTIGVNLGNPVRTFKPESLMQKGSKKPTIITENRVKSIAKSAAKQRKFKVSREEYLRLRLSGMGKDAIAERHNVAIGTLRHYLTEWKIGKPEQEAAVLKELGQ